MMRLLKWTAVLLLIFATGTLMAQEDAGDVTLIPFTHEGYGITGVVPEGWTDAGRGIYARAESAGDATVLAQQAADAALDDVVPSLLPQLQLAALPESAGTVEANGLTWNLYEIEVTAGAITLAVDLALAEQDNRSYIVLLQTTPDDHEELHAAVFLPALDALMPAPEATPEPNLPYSVEDVTFDSGDVTLAGTLTLPEGDGPHPAVVLVSGSGPQDRDETLSPDIALKPFRLIADYLTRQGIAVLRYDDRGVGESTGDHGAATSEDFAADASAAIDYLQTRDEIDPEQIGVLGHSEGGIVAAILGANNPDVAFLVSMAGTAVTGREVLLLQNERLILAEGGTQEQVDLQIEFLNQAFELLDEGEFDAVSDLIYDTVLAQVETLSEDERAALGDLETYAQRAAEQQAELMTSDWMRFFLNYDPAMDWAQTTVPVLGVFGGKDVQVVAEQNAPALEAALNEAGNTDFEIVTIPDANHLFQKAETGSVSEYSSLPGEFIDDFLPTLGDWILDHVTLAE